MSQGCRHLQKVEKAGNGFSPGASRRDQPYPQLDFGPMKPLLNFRLQNCQILSVCCFTECLTKLVGICYGSHRKLIQMMNGTGKCGSQLYIHYSLPPIIHPPSLPHLQNICWLALC